MRQLSTDPPSFPACSQPGPDLTWMTETRILVLIPARMASTRLPGKPLADIAGLPMIVHVLRRAGAPRPGPGAGATDQGAIAPAAETAARRAPMPRPDPAYAPARILRAPGPLAPD